MSVCSILSEPTASSIFTGSSAYSETHTYSIIGTHKVTATVIDCRGGSNSRSSSLTLSRVTATAKVNVLASNTVPSQNIKAGVPIVPLGAFEINVSGEPVFVRGLTFDIYMQGEGSNDNGADVFSVAIVNSEGGLVTNVANGTGSGSVESSNDPHIVGSVTFSGAFFVPVGNNIYTLKGSLGTDLASPSGIGINLATTPSKWDVVGYGFVKKITPTPSSVVRLNQMKILVDVDYVLNESKPLSSGSLSQIASALESARKLLESIAKSINSLTN